PALVLVADGNDDRLERWRGEVVVFRGRAPLADRVPDLDFVEAPELADLPRRDPPAPNGRPALEDADRGHLPLAVPGEPQPVSRSYAARIESFCSPRTSASLSVNSASAPSQGVTSAARVPSSRAEPIGTIALVSRSEIACSTWS